MLAGKKREQSTAYDKLQGADVELKRLGNYDVRRHRYDHDCSDSCAAQRTRSTTWKRELSASEQRRAVWKEAENAFRNELARSDKMSACFQTACQVNINEARQELKAKRMSRWPHKECLHHLGDKDQGFRLSA